MAALRRGRPAWLIVIALLLALSPAPRAVRPALPSALSDAQFRQLVWDASEPPGSFPMENFASNEWTFQDLVPALRARVAPGGVYVGVGPEQNFSYIAAVRPGLAFVVDIRRQNMLEQLLYKAIFELSSDRADFLSRLFARPRPKTVTPQSDPAALFHAFSGVRASQAYFDAQHAAILDCLKTRHRLPLSDTDEQTIEYVYNTFMEGGPSLTYLGAQLAAPSYSFPNGAIVRPNAFLRWPTYTDLMTRPDHEGRNQSFLATEASFAFVKDLETRNLVVPLVGDFAGPKALRTVGTVVKSFGARVTTFYTSNVEQYLFPSKWRQFYDNAATLPIDGTSVFVRCFGRPSPYGRYAYDIAMRLCPIGSFLADVRKGKIKSYDDVAEASGYKF